MGTIVFFLGLMLWACGPKVEEVELVDRSAASIRDYDPLIYVDPFIATGGIGAEIASVSPGGSRPFGMVYVGPDTRADYGAPGFYHCAGYHWEDSYISAFSHTHSQGMGVTDYGTIAVMPQTKWDDKFTSDKERQLAFSHDDEWARPGSYGVRFSEQGIDVSIVATTRGAYHKYEFENGDPTLIFDLAHALGENEVFGGSIEIEPNGVVRGFQNLHGSYSSRFGGLNTWFYAEFEPAPLAVGVWNETQGVLPTEVATDGEKVGGWLTFPAGTEEVSLRLSISYVDVAGAKANFDAELAGRSLEDLQDEGEHIWRETLGNVRVRGDDEEALRVFHSSLYRSYLMPSLFTDSDGRYRGLDGAVHSADFNYYTDFSLWDTFRTLHPWLILVQPEVQVDMLRSLTQMARDGGEVPRWPLGHGYTGGMIGTPADQVFAESWLKGLVDWPVEEAFEASFAHARSGQAKAGRSGLQSYLSKGYVSVEETGQGASKTLEYSWSDYALSEWAHGLGRSDEAEILSLQATNWKNSWDPDQGFFVARRDDGTFQELSNQFFWDEAFVEGNAWHYRWGVPFDVPGLIELQYAGDTDQFITDLDNYWAEVYHEENDYLPDDWYWHGNEPDIHYAYLASMAGRWEESSDPIRWLMANRYFDGPVGLDGNDDSGTLSAWYLFSAVGFYPIAGTDRYAVGSPNFERIEIDLADRTLVVRAPGLSEGARRTVGLSLDGSAWTQPQVSHEALVSGEWLFDLE